MNTIRVIAVLLYSNVCFNACGQSIENNKLTNNSMKNSVTNFILHFQKYEMNIQAAGLAQIPTAKFSDGELYIEYTYQSEGENRKGKMTLIDKMNNRFEGNWKTTADNGNVYQGSLFFIFKTNGEADGYYKYAGSDYKITITLKK